MKHFLTSKFTKALLLFRTKVSRFTLNSALKWILLVIFIIFCLHPGRFPSSSYAQIKRKDIEYFLVEAPNAVKDATRENKPICQLSNSENYMDSLLYPRTSVTKEELQELASALAIKKGGHWKPEHCVSGYHQVSIIVPYRDRHEHLSIFLAFMHSFLVKQNLDYRIIVVEQTHNSTFNRAKLFNVGFVESLKISQSQCYIFHDVDLIPQNLANIYACTHNPRHMSSSLNTFRYNLLYEGLFGGAVSILKKQFQEVNGFSNEFYGWGGEDDDLKNRILSHRMDICRFEAWASRYIMLTHKKERPSETRFEKLKFGFDRFEQDGLSNLEYVVVDRQFRDLYTWLLVRI